MGGLCSICSDTDTQDADQNDVDLINETNPLNSNLTCDKSNYLKIIESTKSKILSSGIVRRLDTGEKENDPLRKWLLKVTLNEDLLNFDSKNILQLKNTDKSDFVIENFNKIVKIEKYDTIADEMAALVAKYTDSLDLEEVNRVVASFKPANPIMANA